jgi:anti-sigma regulatory factor (Ser/Thr protein kinase)
MDNNIHLLLNVADRSYFAIIKKEVHTLTFNAGFSAKKTGEIDIIVAELVSNLVKHGGGGQLMVKLQEVNGNTFLELIGIDAGKGMTDVGRMMVDGVSTQNTLGQGMGAMKRMSDMFQVYSVRDWGTITVIRVYKDEPVYFDPVALNQIRSVIIPKTGERACGDGFFQKTTGNCISLFLGDGLGHGPEAQKAVMQAGEVFMTCQEKEPTLIIRHINALVKKTRGLVGTVVSLDLNERTWRICGIGNIQTRIYDGRELKGYMAYNGIIGLNVPNTLKSHEMPFENGQLLIMCSDGIKSRWDISRYPTIMRYDLTMLCATIIKDFSRNTDDTAVVACKINL